MRDFSEAFLDAYLAAEAASVLHRVGAYRLDGAGPQPMPSVNGNHPAILGLPMLPWLGFFRAQDVIPG